MLRALERRASFASGEDPVTGAAVVACLIASVAIAGCGGGENDLDRLTADNASLAGELVIEVDVNSDRNRGGIDATCARSNPSHYECTAYKVRPGGRVADVTVYRVVRCNGGEWRAKSRETSVFPGYVVHDLGNDYTTGECYNLDQANR